MVLRMNVDNIREYTSHTVDSWRSLREQRPLVHCITNPVTIHSVASALLAVGASPTMASHVAEAAEVTMGCRALVCNMGATLHYEAMQCALDAAQRQGKPIVIDPVGVSGSSYRREWLAAYLEAWKVASVDKACLCIRGNYSEIRALMTRTATGTGVDSIDEITGDQERFRFAEMLCEYASIYRCTIVVSGEEDLISDGREVYGVRNGHPWMRQVTGSGCIASALIGAWSTTGSMLESVIAACVVMGIAGELAGESVERDGTGTESFRIHMMDNLSIMTEDMVRTRARIRKIR